MNPKWILSGLMALALGVSAMTVNGCKDSDQSGHGRQYTCPMKEHSDVVQDNPGNCPKCGMTLVEKK